ncbi:extracellular solute-binding protein [Clostridium boliviensis]|uniref:Extracellular solute-binding protein n=1 Tax=Clostridium boliviensis TaxID=318465 RepID=A0ABU4GNM5_9CLOT|nr:extracellular solute-binding protein [Clostridium boliviensis]MDW2799220.1 extracellular solute-binding protein [Clostridium boliviensis]
MKKKIALLMAAVMAAASLSGCGGSEKAATEDTTAGSVADTTQAVTEGENGDVKLTMSWWGNQVRNEKTQAALDLYTGQNQGIAIEGQFSEWSDYWNKLATSAAGQAIPDIVQMDYSFIDQYVKNGLLEDMTPYIKDGTLDVSNISENTMASGTVNEGVYAICAGINAPSLLYNKTLLDKNGITVKDYMTTDEFIDLCREVYQKTGYKTNVAYYNAGAYLDYFMRGSDVVLYGDKKMGGEEKDYIPFFQMYETGIKEGWFIDPGVFAELSIGSVEQEPLVYGSSPETMSWCAFYNSNQLTAMQKAAPEGMEIGITTWPSADPKKSGYLKSSQFFSVGAHSKNPEEAVKVINFLTNSSDANNILLGERGVPASSVIAQDLAPKMSDVDQKVIKYVNEVVTPNCSPINPPQPDGASEVSNLLNQVQEQLCYGVYDAKTAAEEFYNGANSIMSKK